MEKADRAGAEIVADLAEKFSKIEGVPNGDEIVELVKDIVNTYLNRS